MIANPDTRDALSVTVMLLLSEPSPTIRPLVPSDQVEAAPVIRAELFEEPAKPIQDAPLLTIAPSDMVIVLPRLVALPTTKLLETFRRAPAPLTTRELLLAPTAWPTISVALVTRPLLVITSDPPVLLLLVPMEILLLLVILEVTTTVALSIVVGPE